MEIDTETMDEVVEDLEDENEDFAEIEAEEEEVVVAEEAPETIEEPADCGIKESELDDPEDSGAVKIKHQVLLNEFDATPDVFFSAGGDRLSSLSQGGFKHLTSSVRADTGMTSGRYLFEVRILEQASELEQELRIGFSTAKSSLFLGDGSPENFCFSHRGTFIVPEPGQLSALEVAAACEHMRPHQVVGILLNLDQNSPNSNTVSVFLDGVRAGSPQPIPGYFHGKGLYPTITFANMTLAVNFGRKNMQLQALPFKCHMFADMLEAHHERASDQHQQGTCEVIVPVGLPDAGFFDFADYYVQEHHGIVELSSRRVLEWCHKSGLKRPKKLGPLNSHDRPDFKFSHADLNDRSWQPTLLTLAKLTGRSCIIPEIQSNLLKSDREELLHKFPPSTRKVAVVVMGEPNKSFKQWVHQKIKADYETKVELVEKRKELAAASGETLAPEDIELPQAPIVNDDTWFLPSSDSGVPDVSEKALASSYAKFSLPTESEGFDEVIYMWLGKDAAEEHLRKWILERKATLIVEGLKPGPWFQSKSDAWSKMKKTLQQNHRDYAIKQKQAKEEGGVVLDVASSIDLKMIEDIHNGNGDGTPVYANFKYEDWLLLSWRYELHMLCHAFLEDVADPDRQGIPEEHFPHYFELYYGMKFEPINRLGVGSIAGVLKLLKEPLEFLDAQGTSKILRSKLDRETPFETFVVSIEAYRRDRCRRIEAGDESAQLSFPRPAKAAPPKASPPKTTPPKATPPKTTPAKVPAVKPVVAKFAPATASPKTPPMENIASRTMPAKTVVKIAPRTVVKMPPQVVVKTAPQTATNLKRPLAPDSNGSTNNPATKRPCNNGAPTVSAPKAPIVKRPMGQGIPPGKAPIAKHRPVQ